MAVVGAGLADLAAAFILARGGCVATVYEASDRVGGRARTDRGTVAGIVCELGGEFVDSSHRDMHALACHFGQPLIDTQLPEEVGLKTTVHIEGRHYSIAEVNAAWSAVAPRVAQDIARLSPRVSRAQHGADDAAFDRLSIAEYLETLETERWLRRYIELAYVVEYGLDAGEQSSINLLSMLGTGPTGELLIIGTSDERYKARDGVERIAEGLSRGLLRPVEFGHRLVRLRARGNSYALTFETPGGALEASADVVLLALPFTLLRNVECAELLPPSRWHAVRTMGYGTNGKMLVGTASRLWRAQGRDGGLVSDIGVQSGWDASRQRHGSAGIYTFCLGGAAGVAFGLGDAAEQAARMVKVADDVFPGFAAQYSGLARRVHWASEPYALGSYTCYRPGQWTTIAGDEATPIGGLYFAGEHCAMESQGFMNGAAQTGRLAALQIPGRLA